VVLAPRGKRRATRAPGRSPANPWAATAGLACATWLIIYLGSAPSLEPHALLVVSIATAVWLAPLKTARHALPLVFGSIFAAASGTAVGLLLVSALQPWLSVVSAPHAGLTLLKLAAAIFGVTTLWWKVVEAQTARRVMIVGTDNAADAVAAQLARGSGGHVEVVGNVNVARTEAANAEVSAGLTEFAQVLEAQHPDLVVIADDSSCGAAIGPMLDLGDASPRVVSLAGFFEHAFGCVPVEQLSPMWFMSLLHLHQRRYSGLSKRLFDVVGAALGLLLSAPLLAIISLILRMTDSTFLFRQVRVGQGGGLFEMYKFRTMRADAEEPGSSRWATVDDPRVTRFGRVLRKAHLDELPQLWNVLRGDMSIVGPRPERPEFIEQLETAVPHWGRRLLIKPGLTGWAQIHFGYASDADGAAAKLSYDLWYLRHRSMLLDLAICLKTVSSMVVGDARGR
jgi:exopolysaccharide biosynthesis polyprenyl glycosylphosphotransferase